MSINRTLDSSSCKPLYFLYLGLSNIPWIEHEKLISVLANGTIGLGVLAFANRNFYLSAVSISAGLIMKCIQNHFIHKNEAFLLELDQSNFKVEKALMVVSKGLTPYALAKIFPFDDVEIYYQFMTQCEDVQFKENFLKYVDRKKLKPSCKRLIKRFDTVEKLDAFNQTFIKWTTNFRDWKIFDQTSVTYQLLIKRQSYYQEYKNALKHLVELEKLKFQINELDELFKKQIPFSIMYANF